ncbi:MAG: Rid family hydrolase [Actinomycetota bacterium]
MSASPTEESPLALQLAVRMERGNHPSVVDICRATALATIRLLADRRSQPGGPWHEAVEAWNGARIRKLVRRGRASAWERALTVPGVTVALDGVEARAFVPGPMAEVAEPVAKLQIQSTDLEPAARVDSVDEAGGLTIAMTPDVDMTWGKQAAQCAHAAQRAWMTAPPDEMATWHRAGSPIRVVHPTPELWRTLLERATTVIRDGGYTEIPAGTTTACAWWHQPWEKGEPMSRHEIRLGGPNEARIGLSRAVRVGDHVSVGGTAAINEDGSNVDADDVRAQAIRIWEIIGEALDAAGASLSDIVRTRTLLVDRTDFDVVSAVRRDVLGGTMPTDTIVEVSGFIDPAWRLEIEVDAIVAN